MRFNHVDVRYMIMIDFLFTAHAYGWTLCNVVLAIYIIVDTLPKQHQWDPLHSERANTNYAKVTMSVIIMFQNNLSLCNVKRMVLTINDVMMT